MSFWATNAVFFHDEGRQYCGDAVDHTSDCLAVMENRMSDTTFLTCEEVSARYRGEISVGTLRNWRAMRIGPAYVKIGKAVLYPLDELEAWDKKNLVTCRASKASTDQGNGA